MQGLFSTSTKSKIKTSLPNTLELDVDSLSWVESPLTLVPAWSEVLHRCPLENMHLVKASAKRSHMKHPGLMNASAARTMAGLALSPLMLLATNDASGLMTLASEGAVLSSLTWRDSLVHAIPDHCWTAELSKAQALLDISCFYCAWVGEQGTHASTRKGRLLPMGNNCPAGEQGVREQKLLAVSLIRPR